MKKFESIEALISEIRRVNHTPGGPTAWNVYVDQLCDAYEELEIEAIKLNQISQPIMKLHKKN